MKKRTIFNALMFLLILGLGYILYQQIEEPIAFQKMKTEREKAVIDKLVKIRKAQDAYRGVTGKFGRTSYFTNPAPIASTGEPHCGQRGGLSGS